MRVAVAIAPGMGDRVIACAAAFSHLAVDYDAIGILKRDFAGLLGDPARRQTGGRQAGGRQAGGRQAGRPGHQPLDQAAQEATPAERRRAEAALDHVREQSPRIPHCLYALPGARASGQSLVVELSSVAAAMALRQVAARTRTCRSSVVLAAICAVVARPGSQLPGAGVPAGCPATVSSATLVDYVGCLAQPSIASVEIGGRSFYELAGHAWVRVAEASRHARYDGPKRVAMDELIEHERGMHFTYDPVFNSLVPASWPGLTAGVGFQPEEIDTGVARTELRWRPMPRTGLNEEMPIRFSLNQIDGCLRLDVWSALLPQAELESVLLAVERLLVAAAHGDVPATAGCRTLIGLEPIAGTPDRILVDHCWVNVADVQHLLDDALAARGRPRLRLEGRPAMPARRPLARHRRRHPHARQQAHARCMDVLARHPTAITPGHYVICRTAPADPADPAAWPPPWPRHRPRHQLARGIRRVPAGNAAWFLTRVRPAACMRVAQTAVTGTSDARGTRLDS